MRKITIVLMGLLAALGWLAIINQAFSQSSKDGRFFNSYKIVSFCRADRPEEVEQMIAAVQTGNDQLYLELFRDRGTKCYDTRMFNSPPVNLAFVREMRQVLDTRGRCWSIIELRDGLGTAYVSWTDCPELPGEKA